MPLSSVRPDAATRAWWHFRSKFAQRPKFTREQQFFQYGRLMRIPGAALFLAVAMPQALPISAATPTFNRDVAPIVYQHCAPCHHEGEAAPFSLTSFQEVTRKGKMIAKVTESRLMPPWKADESSFAFRDDRRLAGKDIATLQEWYRQGMPEGDTKDKPDSPKFESGWRLGEPDLVVEMPAAFHVPADGPDIYRNLAVPLGLTEDKWITAIVIRPSSQGVIHHALYYGDSTGRAHLRPAQGAEPGFAGMAAGRSMIPLGGWAVGGQPHFFPEGLALHASKGSDLVVQYHFHPTGKPEAEKSVFGIYFAKKAPARTLTRIMLPPGYSLFSGLDIPPGEKDFVIRDSYILPVAVDAIGVGAHAHYLGKNMRLTATLPDGSAKVMLAINDWDFAWQDRYYYKDFALLPKGTKLDVEIHWDNSTENPRNPSHPPGRVTWGEESKDEMGAVSLFVVAHEEADRATLDADTARHRSELAAARLKADPALARKVMKLFAE